MRDILFRAKSGQTWYYGGVHREKLYCGSIESNDYRYRWCIVTDEEDEYRVKPDTICQYTGLNDKNGTKIFEGDIIKTEQIIPVLGTDIFAVEYAHGNYFIRYNSTVLSLFSVNESAEVIGNIYDNPELIEG